MILPLAALIPLALIACDRAAPIQPVAGKATGDDCALCALFGAFNEAQEEEDQTPAEAAETDSTSSEGGPDLIVQSPSVRDSITLALVSVPTNGGSVTGSGAWDTTTKATLRARPNPGYDFQRWTEGGVPLSTDRVYVMEVTGTHEVSAHFSVNQERGKWNGGQTYTDYYFPKGAYESLAWTFVSVVDPPESLRAEGLLHYYAYNFYLVNFTKDVGGGYAGFQSNGHINGRMWGKVINYSIWGSNGGKTDGMLNANNTESGGHQIMYPFEWVEGQAYRFELREGPSGLDARGKWWGLWVEDMETGSVTFIGEQRVPTKINGRDATRWSGHTAVFGEDLHWWHASTAQYLCRDFQPSSLAILAVTAGAKAQRPLQVNSFVNSGRVETWPNGHATTNCHATLFERANGDVQHNLGFWPEPPPNVLD